MNKKLLFWIITALVVAIGYFVYGFYQGSQEKNLYNEIKNTENNPSASEEPIHLIKMDIKDWKTYTIPDLSIEFRYPAYFGDVIFKTNDRTSCPQMKTYQSGELLPAQDYTVSFSNKPKVGTGGSYMEAKILIAQTENNTIYCGLDIATLGKKMDANQNYVKLNSGRRSIKEEYASKLYTTTGTSVDQFYSLFFVKRNQMILMQPNITFVPYGESAEAKETDNDIVSYVINSKNAEPIRSYLRDFGALMASIKFID